MSSGPTRVASRALARALSRPLHTSGANDKAAHALNALNLAPAAALPPAASSASSWSDSRCSITLACEAHTERAAAGRADGHIRATAARAGLVAEGRVATRGRAWLGGG